MKEQKENTLISGMKVGDIVTSMLSDAELRPTRDYYKECFNFVRKQAEQKTVGEGHAARRWYDEASVRKTIADYIESKRR